MQQHTSENYILNPLLTIKGYQALKDTLSQENDLNAATLRKIKKGQLFVLTTPRKELLINPTIKSFLDCFQTPCTLATVTTHIAQTANASVQAVLPTATNFLDDMLRQGILIEHKDLAEVLAYKATKKDRALVFSIGTIIQGYKILEVIAEKKNFDLYLAEQLATQQQVVLKTLYLPKEEMEEELAYKKALLRQEFGLLRELQGPPNMCAYIDIQIAQDYAFGVMEYIDGQTLKSFLKENQPNLSTRLAFIQQVFDAIAHVHTCGIVHGDIHKSNFLITAEQQIKLFDFDLANHHQLQKNEIKRKGGVYQYFPPEKIRKNTFSYMKAKADYRSEVYQAALIAYYLLYERLPFKALTWQALAKKIKKEAPVFDKQTATQETIPLPLIAILERALSKKPKQRFKSGITLARKWAKYNG